MRRIVLVVTLLLAAAGALALYWYTRPLPVLTVTTWPGEYGRAQAAALMRPYAADRRVDVHLAEWEGDLADLSRAVTSRSYKGDVIDFELPKAVEACNQGLLEKFDAPSLPQGIDGTSAAKDFVKGAVGECWVASVAYSQAILFARSKFTGPQPATLADFFDTAKFPGRRALRQGAKFNLEMALLADGVAPADVYRTLENDAGVMRALNKLDSLKPNLVWWRAAGEPARLVKDGDASFSTVLNSDIFAARADSPGVIWDRQLYEFDVFGVPAGDPRKAMAMDFIRYATGSAPLAHVADWVPLGPARHSSLPLVTQNPELHIAMTPFLPTAPGNFATAFAVDDGWWLKHGPALEARFQAWQAAPH
jgi:putative spermidine/putrescine transport system substrate-binding protein